MDCALQRPLGPRQVSGLDARCARARPPAGQKRQQRMRERDTEICAHVSALDVPGLIVTGASFAFLGCVLRLYFGSVESDYSNKITRLRWRPFDLLATPWATPIIVDLTPWDKYGHTTTAQSLASSSDTEFLAPGLRPEPPTRPLSSSPQWSSYPPRGCKSVQDLSYL